MNNTGINLRGSKNLGIHLALIPYKDKYVPLAYDIVPWEEHERAEVYVKLFAEKQGLPERPIEQYEIRLIQSAKKACEGDRSLVVAERAKIIRIIDQTIAYMATEYFALIYKDGGRIKSPQEVADWITNNTVIPTDFVLGSVAQETIKLNR